MNRTIKRRRIVVGAVATGLLLSTVANASNPAPTHEVSQSVTSQSGNLRLGYSGYAVSVVQYRLASYGYALAVDGQFGPVTDKAVRHWQRSNGLLADGIVGPLTLRSLGLTPADLMEVKPLTGNGCDVALEALRRAGANEQEQGLGVAIAQRESRCTLGAINQNSSTRDNSWGPWQINYYGNLMGSRTALLGPPESNTSSWERAASNFLKLGRTNGWCHWNPPSYCAGR